MTGCPEPIDSQGNIVNTGFIVGSDGVIVIDSGPSRLYGEQQRAAIARVTALPVARVLITHAHPDHFLGNQAYPNDTLATRPATASAIGKNGEALSNNLYRIDQVDFKTLVPGHGPITHDHAAVAQTRDYLRWLYGTLRDAANRGLDVPEVMNLPLPERFQHLAVVNSEYTRSVSHLYPGIELQSLPPIKASPGPT